MHVHHILKQPQACPDSVAYNCQIANRYPIKGHHGDRYPGNETGLDGDDAGCHVRRKAVGQKCRKDDALKEAHQGNPQQRDCMLLDASFLMLHVSLLPQAHRPYGWHLT